MEYQTSTESQRFHLSTASNLPPKKRVTENFYNAKLVTRSVPGGRQQKNAVSDTDNAKYARNKTKNITDTKKYFV